MSFLELRELEKELAELRDRVERLEEGISVVEELLKKIILFYALSQET